MEDDECPACGSMLADRERYAKRHNAYGDEPIPTGLADCPHCGSKKCCVCDMGDDVECLSCLPCDA